MRVEVAESALMELSGAFQRPYKSDRMYHHVVMALGLRSRTIFGGFLQLIVGDWPVASYALLRQMVEVNILLRFLRASPDVRSALWVAEQFRNTRAFVNDVIGDPALRERWEGELPDEAKLAEWTAHIDGARQAALEAQVAGIRDDGPLIVPVSEQVRVLDDAAATEAYVFAYRRFSGDVHVGMASFDQLVVDESHGSGWMSLADVLDPAGFALSGVLA